MLRNREIRIWLFWMLGISLGGLALAFYLSIEAGMMVLIISGLLLCCTFIFTRWRYREVEKLTAYLRQISSGNYSLDVRDNQEGELSILKNEIYKVTHRLSEQSALLKQDKTQLVDAISDISHQLKTPLTSMTMMADLLSRSDLPVNKRVEFARKIRIQLERIEWLVSSLLKLSRIDAGAVEFRKEKVFVNQLIQQSLETVLIPMELKEQIVKIEGDDQISFIGDLNWTAEAITNILKNCVEHTQAGGTIKVSYSDNALFTEIIIADNGKGIPKEDMAYIFQRFYKGKNAGEDSVGIGLAMAQSIVTGQGGDIEVKSEEGKGTQFILKFYKKGSD